MSSSAVGPIVLFWDRLNAHLACGMRQFIADRDWLPPVNCPGCTPDLSPVEGIRSVLRRGCLSNTAVRERPGALIRLSPRDIANSR